IGILPFAGIDAATIAEIQKGMEQHTQVKFTLLKETALPAFAFYKPRQRYIADSLLLFLSNYNDHKFDKIIAITAHDISTKKNGYVNYGIMGQGYCPGQACVVSTFRPKKNVSRKQFIDRMITLALHELGHTYSLPHCPDQKCFMVDAEGKMKLDNTKSYCADCRSTLVKKGILRSAQQ
ncbi:MAG TPA: hypothetical protein VHM26_15155, partial [Chitinophagaceae bacterium]|nr:hypothetical protein [Chitinophagaceae bacterium]